MKGFTKWIRKNREPKEWAVTTMYQLASVALGIDLIILMKNSSETMRPAAPNDLYTHIRATLGVKMVAIFHDETHHEALRPTGPLPMEAEEFRPNYTCMIWVNPNEIKGEMPIHPFKKKFLRDGNREVLDI